MSAVVETLVFCDGCGANCNGDDRAYSARIIRMFRAKHGWRQIGRKDYCLECSDKLRRGEKLNKQEPV